MIFETLSNIFNSDNINESKKSNSISKALKSISTYGMNYDDDVVKNMRAIPANDNLLPDKEKMVIKNLMGLNTSNWRLKKNENKSFFEKDLSYKREVLRKMAMQPELEDILDVMCNECIVYDDDCNYIGQPNIDAQVLQSLNESVMNEIKKSIDVSFFKFYNLLSWKNNAWNEFKRFLIDGVLAYEIVYDNIAYPKSIIGIIQLDPATLTKSQNGTLTEWIQYKGVLGRERKLLDAQIIYIQYEDSGVTQRQSYLERLIRPFNIYRIIEQAQIIWTVTQSSFKTMFTIPVGGMSRAMGEMTLNSTMQRYREDITFNGESGELLINGKTNMPFNKEYWLPENENGKPTLETITDNGPNLNDNEQLKFFKNSLLKMSKLPGNRFNSEDGGGNWFGMDVGSYQREEINLSRFVGRLRNTFSEIIIKPIQIQTALSIPSIKNDKRILDAISFKFNTYNQFEELINIEIMTKRATFIQELKDSVTELDKDGNERSFFANKFLIEKYLKLSNADLELNEKYKKIEAGEEPEESEEELTDIEEPENSEEETSTEEPDKEESDAKEKTKDTEEEPKELNSEDNPEILGDVKPEQ